MSTINDQTSVVKETADKYEEALRPPADEGEWASYIPGAEAARVNPVSRDSASTPVREDRR